ncbi:MAG: hypothetical protein IPK75_01045 [Acidobacteria bacterium]|jgi:hypothetical protein|nr:hypothetical protein [Acidobacteriota bacterium]
MEKIAAPIIALVSIFLYFTHDAGFNFERASLEKRIAFVERQAHQAADGGHFTVRSGADAFYISGDQMLARLKMSADGLAFGRNRPAMVRQACEGYVGSYLDEHSIALRLEFYRDAGTMAGTISLSPSACASYVAQASKG